MYLNIARIYFKPQIEGLIMQLQTNPSSSLKICFWD